MWYRVKERKAVPYRRVYSGATTLLGAQTAILILSAGMSAYPGIPSESLPVSLVDVGVIVLAAVFCWAVNFGLVLAALALYNPTVRASDLFENFNEQLVDAAAFGLGFVSAILVVHQPLALLGVMIAMVVFGRSLLVSQYEHAARIDSKTGLATAGRWHDFAAEMLSRARHHQTNLGLLIVDLDHFKSLNDTYGHSFGDDALKSVAEELRSEVRELDACGRWGGEEFTVLVSDVGSAQNVHRVAERIRLRIQSIVLQPPDQTDETVTISASLGGVFYVPDETTTLDELLLAADSALYEAKNDGRNTVRMTTAGTAQPPADDRGPVSTTDSESGDDADTETVRRQDSE
ncbi:GGDEF domain-containing protein [Actinobacteria bacterium YIM 96077]|uniref:GGDEF domain-containing protein n=2 Tax=Phytoactinopolyspora halophila TaxID=1981511 RepID=A0A329QHQ5_9ACTN|nr:GGDEF domain-containing protein [Actinobacteria bacterium YIM 96077]RAW11895.1 GGDEF domain-containing protein [Phytoactinopolyspora halophila]